MKLYSYVVARDYGFAPNPFYGFCTLATCKPRIRATAAIGDWIVGTGSSAKGRSGCLVFAMRVTEALTFEDYWTDPRFARKRPNLQGSTKQTFGDNIYHRAEDGTWLQENSHHSFHDGSPNPENVDHDTSVDRVLVSNHYTYRGGQGPAIPERFRDFGGVDLVVGRQGHKCNFPDELVEQFLAWLEESGLNGYAGRPLNW